MRQLRGIIIAISAGLVLLIAAALATAQGINLGPQLLYTWNVNENSLTGQVGSFITLGGTTVTRPISYSFGWTAAGTAFDSCTFNLQGSNDGSTWTNLDSVSAVSCATSGIEYINGHPVLYVRLKLVALTGGDATSAIAFTYAGSAAASFPIATTTILGGVKPDGSTCTVNGTTGVLSCTGSSYTLPIATTSILGGVKPDGTICTVNGSTGALICAPSSAQILTALGYTPANCTAGTSPSDCLVLDGSGYVPAGNLVAANEPAVTTTVSSGAIGVSGNNNIVICTTTCTVTPITPAAGVQLCVRNAPGSATAITMAALGSGKYYELTSHASWGTANHTTVSGGVATDQICFVGYDANHYAVASYSGTWTD